MIKKFLVLISLFYSSIFIAQSSDRTLTKDELFEHVSIEVCECMTKNEGVEISALSGCLENNMNKYDEKLKSIINKDSTLFNGITSDQLGEEFVEIMQIPLVENCDSFYQYFKKIKDDVINGLYQFQSQETLDSLYSINEKEHNSNYYLQRGLLNFAHKNIDKSIQDITKSIEIDPKEDLYMFLAWIYTENGNLDRALENYDKYISLTNSAEMKIMKAVSIREIKEKNKSLD